MGESIVYVSFGQKLTRFWKRPGLLLALILSAFLGLGGPLRAYAADGDLDNSFSGDGKQTTGFAGSTDGANSVAIQSDGKIILGGYTFVPDIPRAGDSGSMGAGQYDFALVRYNTNGT